MSMWHAFDAGPDGLQRVLCSRQVARITKQVTEAAEYPGSNAVTGGRGIVMVGFRALYQGFMVIRSEEKSAVLISEMRQHDLGQFNGELQVSVAPAYLQ